MSKLSWSTPVQYIPLVGPVMATRLEKLDIATVGDMLTHKPHRYDDFSKIKKISELHDGEMVTVLAEVTTLNNIFTRSRKQIQKALFSDDTGTIEVTWFNQPFILSSLKGVKKVALAGKAVQQGTRFTLLAPEIEVIRTEKLLHTGRLVPIYPETRGVSSKWLRGRINFLLESGVVTDYLNDTIRNTQHLIELKKALHQLHFPKTYEEITLATERLAFDELFTRQIEAEVKRREWNNQVNIAPFDWKQNDLDRFISTLPFQLTGDQIKVIDDLKADFKKGHPMNRLVQGDVGSGKTVVAAFAIYIARLNQMSSLIMAPTEILAEQHYATLSKILSPFGIQVGIQTGSKKVQSKTVKTENKYDVLVGTHALLEKHVRLENVGLVVIDEQHRFGVRQRSLLREKGALPHVLTMTATPIPRTIALTLYGDLDLSVITHMPAGRRRIKTWVVAPHKRKNAYEWIAKTLTQSNVRQQVFIVCPFIEPSESLETVKSATSEYDTLRKIFPSFKLALLHGRMKSTEKNSILEQFRRGDFDMLVCTPVVEVGIDIPTATIMVIEGAERFGLAALHQLRGRVGRGSEQSYCLLFSSNDAADTDRLKFMEKAASGAELAELDLKIRGPGQVYGVAQHGRDRLKIATYTDTQLIERARKEAYALVAKDPDLSDHPLLKERVSSGTIKEIAPD